MKPDLNRPCTAFAGTTRLASGTVLDVARSVKRQLESNPASLILVFDDETSAQLELDLRGTVDDVASRYAPTAAAASGPGRPRLGVVAREVTLLPRHWEWLATQPGGASTTLRRLVEEARKHRSPADRKRETQDATYKFMLVMGGNLPRYEEALRALYAGRTDDLFAAIAAWPKDVREHVEKLATL